MPSIHETAYPRLKNSPSPRELVTVYSPTKDEIVLAGRVARSSTARLGFLILLKTFQRLGYFMLIRDVPASIVEHIAHDLGFLDAPPGLSEYDDSGTRRRHVPIVREYLGARPFCEEGLALLCRVVRDADNRAPLNYAGRGHAELLSRQTTLTKETGFRQDGNHGFFATLGHHRELHLATLDVKHRIRCVSLRKDGFIGEVRLTRFSSGEFR